MSQPKENTDDSLLEAAFSITEYVYRILADLPEEEFFFTTTNLRLSANEMLYYVALAVGCREPHDAKSDWSSAHKYALALRMMYRFATKENFVELEPAIMLQIDQLLADIVTGTKRSHEQAKDLDQAEMADLRIKSEISKGIK